MKEENSLDIGTLLAMVEKLKRQIQIGPDITDEQKREYLIDADYIKNELKRLKPKRSVIELILESMLSVPSLSKSVEAIIGHLHQKDDKT